MQTTSKRNNFTKYDLKEIIKNENPKEHFQPPSSSVFKKAKKIQINPKKKAPPTRAEITEKNLQNKFQKLTSLIENGKLKGIHRKSISKNKSKDLKCINYLWVIFFVKKFVEILKMKTVESKLKKFETYHQTVFDDVVFSKNDLNWKKAHLNNPISQFYVK